MSEKPISPLRQRMLEDMSVRRFAPDTQREYILAVKRLAAFLGRTPDTATAEELRAFQLHLTQTGVRPPYGNATREATSLKAISLDIDAVRQSIDRIAANVATGQEQMTRRIEHSIERNTDLLATGQDETTREISDLQTFEQYVLHRISTLPPRPAPATVSKPVLRSPQAPIQLIPARNP